MNGEQRGKDPEEECPENPVAQGLLLLMPRQAEHENGEDECVVGAEEPLEGNKQTDGDQIGDVEVHSGARRP
jgi:hypothetical protein